MKKNFPIMKYGITMAMALALLSSSFLQAMAADDSTSTSVATSTETEYASSVVAYTEDTSGTQSDVSISYSELETQAASAVEDAASSTVASQADSEEADSTASMQASEAVQYDEQPTTLQEVQAAIESYEANYAALVEQGSTDAAQALQKPHWEFAVETALMPEGYACIEVTDDANFSAAYFTFNKTVVYDAQPTTLEEVQALIEQYEASYAAFEDETDDTVTQAPQKPRWEFAVEEALMPEGYACIEVLDDEEFGAAYFTFIVQSSFAYDFQPEIIEDVKAAIFTYICGGEQRKPYWEFEVAAELMPNGYYCIYVENDEEFGAPYYTFTVNLRTRSGGNYTIVGSGSSADPYMIQDGADLYAFAKSVTESQVNYAGVYFQLENDVDISSYSTWPGIGRQAYSGYTNAYFGGYFDGDNKTISGLKGTDPNGYGQYGLFGRAVGATIQNVYLTLGGNVSAAYDTGAFIGVADDGTVINNCHVDGNGNTVSVTGGGRAGGFVGWTNAGSSTGGLTGGSGSTVYISNCSVTNIKTTASGNYAAGFAGVIYNAVLDNCYAENTTNTSGEYAAGFAGVIHGSGAVNNCYTIAPVVTGRSGCGGGFTGNIYEYSSATGCYAIDPQVSSYSYAGGFAAFVHNGTVTNCYAAGGKVQTTTIYIAGGFVGEAAYATSITNCYAQTDVVSKTTSAGGFVGYLSATGSAVIRNCYATGTATGTNYVGGFAGEKHGGSIYYSYATGTVSGTGARVGGFIGYPVSTANIRDCFFDTTTTRQSNALGGDTSINVTALSTADMILIASYPSTWGVQENFLGAAGGTGSDSSPWYIDDDITYPYLYYQYDGHSEADTNYFLANTRYADNTSLGQKRADFTLAQNSLPLNVKSAGAVKAYLPYSGTSRYDITTTGYTDIPGLTYSATNLNSLGSISATNIIAFDGSPDLEKSNNTADWDVADATTYTYVGDMVSYTLHLANYSDVNNWENVVLTDVLGKGVTLVDNTLKVVDNSGTYVAVTYWDGNAATQPSDSAKPYYTYQYDSTKTTSDGRSTGTYVITVYLPDFAAIASTGDVTEYTVTFDAFITKESASVFTDATTYTGHIRNDATAVGDFVNYVDGTVVVSGLEVEDSDNDEDPVYNKFTVSYNDNLDDNNTSDTTDTEIIEGYYLTDGTQTHTVLSLSAVQALSGTGFTRNGYKFAGWLAKDSLGNTVAVYTLDANGILMPDSSVAGYYGITFNVTDDIVLHAQWQLDAVFAFYKVNGVDRTTLLADASFALYEYQGSGAPPSDALVDTASPGGNWVQVGSTVTTDTTGLVSFALGEVSAGSYYQLVETAAPANYQLPSGQWLVYISSVVNGTVTYTITGVAGADGATPPAFFTNTAGEYALINIPAVGLPASGGVGNTPYMLAGLFMVLIGMLSIVRASARRRKSRLVHKRA